MQVTKAQSLSYDILHVSAGCWANGAGLSESVALLALAQARAGKRVAITFLDDHPTHPVLERCRGVGVAVIPIHRRMRDPFYLSLHLIRQLPLLIAQSAYVYIHGAWTFPIYWAARCAQKNNVPYAVFPHGSFDPVRLAYGKYRKSLMWHLFNADVLRRAQWLHAASEREAMWSRDLLKTECPPIKRIPLGVDGEALDAVPPQPRTKTFLYLGRNHPLKGLDLLLQAWQNAHLGDDWQLHLITPHISSFPKGVVCLGERYGEEKIKALKSATCLVLPTRSENFGLVVAEALWCETPVICTNGAPWEVLGEYWTDISVEALTHALQKMASLTDAERTARFQPLFLAARAHFAWKQFVD